MFKSCVKYEQQFGSYFTQPWFIPYTTFHSVFRVHRPSPCKSPSRKSRVRQYYWNWVGRGYLCGSYRISMAVMGSICSCYDIYILLFLEKIVLRGSNGTDLREGVTVDLPWYVSRGVPVKLCNQLLFSNQLQTCCWANHGYCYTRDMMKHDLWLAELQFCNWLLNSNWLQSFMLHPPVINSNIQCELKI